MAMPVLATKLYVPAPRARAVSRPALIERLNEGLRAGRKLTLISAPAGFGKSSVLAEWIAGIHEVNASVRVAWLSLDDNDNDPERFLTYLVAALIRANPTLTTLHGDAPRSVEETVTNLVNAVATGSDEMLLVLDDFHLIENPSVRDGVAFLLDNLPSTLHVAIASRSDPLLPVARLRAGGELTELRAADLRFSPDETAAFLTEMMGLALSPDDVATLESRTEGWIAGLQLAALSLRDRTDAAAFITGFAGSHRFVIDYLAEEVLQRQPDRTRQFLLQTSILGRFNGSLCDSITGEADGAEMLQSLERANLFVVPLDDRREWYRYHHLFADVLRARLASEGTGPAERLNGLASEWFERNALADEAVRHAIAARDFDRAARVIEATIPGVRASRQDTTLLAWLALLPSETIGRRPVLGVFAAWSALVSGELAIAEARLSKAEELLNAAASGDGAGAHESAPGPELDRAPVTICLYRAALAQSRGDFAAMRAHAEKALSLTSSDDLMGHGAATGMLGLAAWAEGDLEAAVEAFGETRSRLRLAGNLADALSTTMVAADMLTTLGRIREAQLAYNDAIALAATRENPRAQPAADLHAGISECLREGNRLTEAHDHLAASEALGPQASSHEHRYRWFVAMARLKEAEGDPDSALTFLASAADHYIRGFFPEVRPIGGMAARIRIRQGRLKDARAWVTEQHLAADDTLSYLSEFGHITLARLLIAEQRGDPNGGDPDAATVLLDRLLDAATTGRRAGSVNEILVLQALAHEVGGRRFEAIRSLLRVLERAEPEGYVRLFVDEGAAMGVLLRAALESVGRPDYVRSLLDALDRAAGPGAAMAGDAPGVRLSELLSEPLSDPLSDREAQVLRLLATDLSGPEIARELYISLNTMRSHTKHIFAKLDVNSRAAAVQRGAELDLI